MTDRHAPPDTTTHEPRRAALGRPPLDAFDTTAVVGLDTAAVVGHLRELHRSFRDRPGSGPAAETDTLFRRLVAVATSARSDAEIAEILADPVIEQITPGLRQLSALGEFELEQDWARRIVGSADPHATFADYPYREDYERVTRWEHHAVVAVTGVPLRRVLVIGAGPMPLTPLLLAQHYGVHVRAVDIEPDATRLGADLARALGIEGVEFHCGDVLSYREFAGYELVCVAALVGTERSTKAEVLGHLRTHMDPGSLVLVRGAHSMHTLLYPDTMVDDLGGLAPLVVIHRYTDVANSLVIAQIPP